MQGRRMICPLVLAMAAGTATAQAAPKYRIQDLGTLQGGIESLLPTGLNNAGVVVGQSVNNDRAVSIRAAFSWEGERMRALGPYGRWGLYYEAEDINDAGVAVGSYRQQTARITMPVMFRNGEIIDLSPNPPGSRKDGKALAINGAGTVVGYFNDRAFIHEGGVSRYIPAGKSNQVVRALDINDSGLVVGKAYRGDAHSFLWDGTQVTRVRRFAPGNNTFEPAAINNAGAVVGEVYLPQPGSDVLRQGVIYAAGRYQLLGEAGTVLNYLQPRDINDAGWVVGVTRRDGSIDNRPFLWRDGQALDLQDMLVADTASAGWDLDTAVDVNERGQILGYGYIDGATQPRAFLATPVPEPGSWALLLGGLGLLGARLRRRAPADATRPG